MGVMRTIYTRIAGTCCDVEDDGQRASIRTWGLIANRSGAKRVIEVVGDSSDLDVMTSDMENMITAWRDSYGGNDDTD